ncbi:MAG: hypothetical protein HQM12_20085 [SAR324 cluster bacterium]|nr:hypothetical protein [SAR324 cluster bacterium]
MKNLSIEDAMATKHLQLNKGRDWKLSPVTLWEILMTTDEVHREKIIYFCQHLFSKEILPTPSELIISFIQQGMPKIENPRELKSHSAIADVWRDLVDNKNKTFVIDYNDLKHRIRFIQSFTKNIHQLIKKGDLILGSDESFVGYDVSLSNLVNDLPFIKSGKQATPEKRRAYKVSLYYILLILCAEAELENEVIQSFWKGLGIDSTLDRVFYVVKELPSLVHRGPFIVMAYMTIAQASGKYPRGVWFDSLHSIYMTYVDKIFTSDEHFLGLREVIPEPILQMKIHHMDEVKITRHNLNQFGTSHT